MSPARSARSPLPPRPQTLGEEIANAVTHGLGLVGSLAALPLLVLGARQDPWTLVGGAIFGVTLVLLYLASTVYHALRPSRAKDVWRLVDHSAIYLLIAGSYTPFALGALRGRLGTTLLVAIWVLAVLGVVAKWTIGTRFPRLSTAAYLGMGWLGAIAIGPLADTVGTAGVAWLLAGGLAYTAGVVFYVLDGRLRYAHAVWHLFVAGGSACHVVAVVRHVLPNA